VLVYAILVSWQCVISGVRSTISGAVVVVEYSRGGANGKLGAVVTATFEAESGENSADWLS
jgi:hypothetical protein